LKIIAKYFSKDMRAFLPAVFFAVLLLAACQEKNIPGLEVQPPSDKMEVIYTDTITVVSYTVAESKIRTDETGLNLAGSYLDPLFGFAEASFYTQFLLPVPNLNFGNPSEITVDSMVLSLKYESLYGSLDAQTFKVYEVTQDMNSSDVYYSNDSIAYNFSEVGALYNHVPNYSDSINLNGTNTAPHLRIKLKQSFAQKFANNSGSSTFANNDNFKSFFKGLYIKTDNIPVVEKGAILYFQLLHPISKLTLYYTNTSTNERSSVDFVINETCARFNKFRQNHNHSSSTNMVYTHLNDSIAGENSVYVQSMGGLKSKIYFPFLKNLSTNNKILINQAQLVLSMKEEGTYTNRFQSHSKLSLAAAREDGTNAIMIDQLEGDAYFGGTYNSANKQYVFNITRHLQRVLNGQTSDFGLFVLPAGGAITGNRTVLHGSDKNNPKHIKLILTYTKL
jgi:hypothetical protein